MIQREQLAALFAGMDPGQRAAWIKAGEALNAKNGQRHCFERLSEQGAPLSDLHQVEELIAYFHKEFMDAVADPILKPVLLALRQMENR